MAHIATPEAFCWLYAIGCIDMARQKGLLDERAYDIALSHLKNKTTPEPELIRAWFKRPFAKLERDGKPCTLKEMQRYWRVTHQNPKEPTRVFMAEVLTVGMPDAAPETVQLSKNGTLFVALNVHGYVLRYGMTVYVHQYIVAEVEE